MVLKVQIFIFGLKKEQVKGMKRIDNVEKYIKGDSPFDADFGEVILIVAKHESKTAHPENKEVEHINNIVFPDFRRICFIRTSGHDVECIVILKIIALGDLLVLEF